MFHIAGPTDRTDPGPRLAGWRDTLADAAAVLPLPLVGDWTAESGYELGRRLAARGDVTAIFAANDQMALGVLRALFDTGRRVPRDVSVVGFDATPQAEFFSPPLTTVSQNFTELGRRSLELLLSRDRSRPERTGPRHDPGGVDPPRQHRTARLIRRPASPSGHPGDRARAAPRFLWSCADSPNSLFGAGDIL